MKEINGEKSTDRTDRKDFLERIKAAGQSSTSNVFSKIGEELVENKILDDSKGRE